MFTYKIVAGSLGVCYGGTGNADNLPNEVETVKLYQTFGIEKMRIYAPYTQILQALRNSGIQLIVGVPNDILKTVATDPSAAANWVQTNIKDYASDVEFRYIAVGNEVKPEASDQAPYVLPAMQNIHSEIVSAALQDRIKVSTAVDTNLLAVFDPPSAGEFSKGARHFIEQIICFLKRTNSPLLANIYPYFRVKYNGQRASYALFTEKEVTVRDQNGLEYRNLFDALMDALYSGLEKLNSGDLEIVVAESGWPSAGGDGEVETTENAGVYYRNLVDHVKGGTPKRPGSALETFLFSMFDENKKHGDQIEKHFGLFFPNKQLKYDNITFK